MSSGNGIAEWDNEYARLARVSNQLRSSRSTSQDDRLAFSQAVSRLERSLETMTSLLSGAEVQRRRRLVQGLRNATNAAATPTTSPTVAATGTGTHQHQHQQQQQSLMESALQQQDDMIDELAVGVSRLKDQTQIIGDEAKMHVTLLDDMERNLDLAHRGLEGETRRAERLQQDQSVWRLQLTVAGLSVLLVLLILMGLS